MKKSTLKEKLLKGALEKLLNRKIWLSESNVQNFIPGLTYNIFCFKSDGKHEDLKEPFENKESLVKRTDALLRNPNYTKIKIYRSDNNFLVHDAIKRTPKPRNDWSKNVGRDDIEESDENSDYDSLSIINALLSEQVNNANTRLETGQTLTQLITDQPEHNITAEGTFVAEFDYQNNHYTLDIDYALLYNISQYSEENPPASRTEVFLNPQNSRISELRLMDQNDKEIFISPKKLGRDWQKIMSAIDYLVDDIN
jgi:hypothetical protein